MRLADLAPFFIDAAGGRKGVGLVCNCPCGNDEEEHRLYVPFANPLDGGSQADTKGWQRTGDTFDTLTLSPSVHRTSDCRWHGRFANGEVTTC